METNQYQNFDCTDGGTFFSFYGDGTPYYPNSQGDGGFGVLMFIEYRGYVYDSVYNQPIVGYQGCTTGFTVEQFKTEIDASDSYPVGYSKVIATYPSFKSEIEIPSGSIIVDNGIGVSAFELTTE